MWVHSLRCEIVARYQIDEWDRTEPLQNMLPTMSDTFDNFLGFDRHVSDTL